MSKKPNARASDSPRLSCSRVITGVRWLIAFAALGSAWGAKALVSPGGGDGGSSGSYVTAYFEHGVNLLRAGEEVKPLGPDLAGDLVNVYSGGLSFRHTDLSIPGNSKLTVAVGRTLTLGKKEALFGEGLFGDWDIDIPHLHTRSAQTVVGATGDLIGGGWYGLAPDGVTLNRLRCTNWQRGMDGVGRASGGQLQVTTYRSYWDGYHMYIPGEGDQTMQGRTSNGVTWTTAQPSDGSAYPVITKEGTNFSCLTNAANDGGDGFLAKTPDGLRYRFDHLVMRSATTYNSPGFGMARKDVWILPTQISDRFGNWVNYNWDTTDPWMLNSITSSDGRTVTFTYYAGSHRVQSVTDGKFTWNYAYQTVAGTYGNPASYYLQTVTQPDTHTWTFDLSNLETDPHTLYDPGCYANFSVPDTSIRTGTVTSPSFATATFHMSLMWHGHSNVPGNTEGCTEGTLTPNPVPQFTASYTLTDKILSGPGMPTMMWTYGYPAPTSADGSWGPCSGCVATRVVTVKDPTGAVVRNTYGTRYAVDEGLLLTSEEGWTTSGALRKTDYTYRAANAGPYPPAIGAGPGAGPGESMTQYHPLETRTITQQGATFTLAVTSFDTQARPLTSLASSSLGYSRNLGTTYFDDTNNWLLGLVRSKSIDGIETERNDYFTTNGLPQNTYAYGKKTASFTYNTDGTLATRADGLNQRTTYTNYRRGLPQKITYMDGTYQSAVVEDRGLLSTVTDEAGNTWGYGYDTMGRLSRVTAPTGDPVSYNVRTLTFESVPNTEYGLPANHWRQTITEGNAVTVYYFDARWRKLLSDSYDLSNRAKTERMQRFTYDPYNRPLHSSYPAASISDVNAVTIGVTKGYDALGRETSSTADSELGKRLLTKTEYLTGFNTRVTDPRGNYIGRAFQAFDDPTASAVTRITLPEGATVTIARDNFGKATSINRSGTWNGQTVSATRSYVYDANQLLCKTVEPEIGATVVNYDAANNLSWQAPGLTNLTGTTSCDTTQVADARKTQFRYDQRNRLSSTMFGDGSPSVGTTYTPDGLPQTVSADGSVWTYTYNHRRLLTKESLAFGGSTYDLIWGIGASGQTTQVTYPDAGIVTFAPDAFGHATAIAGHATSITYYPNGGVQSYTLGNGVTHRVTQNARGLPAEIADSGVIDDAYAYDENGNVLSITDKQSGSTTRSMSYDNLDRLKTVTSSNALLAGSYSYDPLNNLRTSTVGSRVASHSYDPNTNQLTSMTINGKLTSYAYDGQGNVQQRGAQTFVFDNGNRMRSAIGVASYTYDGWGRRTSTTNADGSSTVSVYEKAGRLMWSVATKAGRTTRTRFVWLGDKAISETDADTFVRNYTHTDVLGSPEARSNGSGVVTSRTAYEAYGNPASGTIPAGIGFTGHVSEASTGLVYMQQRYYDPIAARFMSTDPVAADTSTGDLFSRYEYASSNPFRYSDPDGRQAAVAACGGGPVACGVGVVVTIVVAAKAVNDTAKAMEAHSSESSSSSESGGPSPAGSGKQVASPPAGAAGAPGAAPDLPSDLVGTQDKGSRQQGNRHNSGPLDPAHGGAGDAGSDFEHLTGGQNGPAPAGSTYPIGTQIGTNGIVLRPGAGSTGPRIDIPANGDKPHETLHYPAK